MKWGTVKHCTRQCRSVKSVKSLFIVDLFLLSAMIDASEHLFPWRPSKHQTRGGTEEEGDDLPHCVSCPWTRYEAI